MKIMLVEDEELIKEAMVAYFKQYNIDCVSFLNGKEALRFYKQNKEGIDLIVTDYEMPIKNGLELIEDLRKIDLNHPPIILNTCKQDLFLEKEVNAIEPDKIIFYNKFQNIENLITQIQILYVKNKVVNK